MSILGYGNPDTTSPLSNRRDGCPSMLKSSVNWCTGGSGVSVAGFDTRYTPLPRTRCSPNVFHPTIHSTSSTRNSSSPDAVDPVGVSRHTPRAGPM